MSPNSEMQLVRTACFPKCTSGHLATVCSSLTCGAFSPCNNFHLFLLKHFTAFLWHIHTAIIAALASGITTELEVTVMWSLSV